MQWVLLSVVSLQAVWCQTCEERSSCTSELTLRLWLEENNLYQIDIVDSLTTYNVTTVQQFQSLNTTEIESIWHVAANNIHQRLQNLSKPPQALKATSTKQRGTTTQEQLDAINQLNKETKVKEEEIFSFLEENNLLIFNEVCKKEKIFMNHLQFSDTNQIVELLHNKNNNKSAIIDCLRLKSSIIKLKNDMNIKFTDHKNLEIKRSKKNLFKEENDILEQITNEQLKMLDFVDVILNVLNETKNAYNKQAHGINELNQQINSQVAARNNELIAMLQTWKYNKIEQISDVLVGVESYVDNLQKALNKSYEHIEDNNLEDRERQKLLTQQSVSLYNTFHRYQNLSQFSVYVNQIASSVVFDALNGDKLNESIATYGQITRNDVNIIASIKMVNVSQHALSTSILWSYKLQQYGNDTICNRVNLYVDGVQTDYLWHVVSQNTSMTICNASINNNILPVLEQQQWIEKAYQSYAFRVEYEMLWPIKTSISDQMTNDRDVLLRLLRRNNLEMFVDTFDDSGQYLNDFFLSDHSIQQLITDHMHSIADCSIFDTLLFMATVVKWESDQSVKLTKLKEMLFKIQTSSNLPFHPQEQAVLDSVQNKQLEMNRFLDIILNITRNAKQTASDHKQTIDVTFNELVQRKTSLISDLTKFEVEKFDQISFAIDAVEKYNKYLQKDLKTLFECIDDNKEDIENRKRLLMNHGENIQQFHSKYMSDWPRVRFSDYIKDIDPP